MFNTLASYLLGSTSNSDNKTVTEETSEIVDQLNLTTTSCEDDDDWLLVVEKTQKQQEDEDSLTRTDSEEELPIVAIKNSPKNNSKRNRNGNKKFIKMAAIGNSMDESWFVTPPPCFTSTGPIQIQTSPLENLLIEHPSMSVYHSLRSGDGIYEDDDNIVVVDFDFGTIEGPAADRTHVRFD